MLPGMLLLARSRGSHYRKTFPPLCVALLLLALVASCGGVGINGTTTTGLQGTQPGTYNIIVTGTSGTLSHQTPAATLIVNQ
jgi:hypothetical protein